jgi:hypothetical protein
MPTAIRDIVVHGSVAYCMSELSGIHIVDVSNPERPRVAGGIDALPGFLDAGSGRLWMTREGGLFAAPLHCARPQPVSRESPSPHGRSEPNPFRDVTSLSFVIGSPGQVSLDVYDLQGRRVWVDAWHVSSAGEHDVLWDGRDRSGERLPSGVYFYELTTGSARQRGKLTILR